MSGYNIGGTNASGQVSCCGHSHVNFFSHPSKIPDIGNFGLIDQDTPSDVYTKVRCGKSFFSYPTTNLRVNSIFGEQTSWQDGETEMELVFSDEFNTDGRSFYSGDDPYWEAVDMHYWSTNDLEWYLVLLRHVLVRIGIKILIEFSGTTRQL